MIRPVAVAVLLGIAACSESRDEPAVSYRRAAQEATLVLEARCGECHIGYYPTALPEALAVFDLSIDEWPRRMTDQHLARLADRLIAPLDMRGRPQAVPASEVARVRRLIDYEARARRRR